LFSFGYGLVLQNIGGEHYFWGALSSGVTFVATLLQWLQYREQWFGWIFVYIVSIVLWAVAGNVLMVVMSAGCLIFSFTGMFSWWKNSSAKDARLIS
jgi:nicotinamide mononucleotide transporter PnuC